MLMPKRVKRRKQFRGSMKGKALRGNQITHGEYGGNGAMLDPFQPDRGCPYRNDALHQAWR